MSITVSSLLRAPVVFVTGKGGVGKTTIAAALALASHSTGKRTAYVEFQDGESGDRVLPRDSGVAHVVFTYDEALVDTLGSVLGARILARALVSHGALRRLIRAIPALPEFAFLDRVRALHSEQHYDHIVVDLPASGHALDWLRVPKAFARFLGKSPLGAIGSRIHNEIIANGNSEVVVVTLAEPFVVKETEHLCKRMRDELDIAPSLVVVNRVVPPDPDGALEAATAVPAVNPSLAEPAYELIAILEARAGQAEDTAYAYRLARSLDGARIVAVPNAPHDPPATLVADWLLRGEVS